MLLFPITVLLSHEGGMGVRSVALSLTFEVGWAGQELFRAAREVGNEGATGGGIRIRFRTGECQESLVPHRASGLLGAVVSARLALAACRFPERRRACGQVISLTFDKLLEAQDDDSVSADHPCRAAGWFAEATAHLLFQTLPTFDCCLGVQRSSTPTLACGERFWGVVSGNSQTSALAFCWLASACGGG